jgi:sugar O-acyltransferase (sialic acid O-acetyltransferase NeuD family)
MNEKGRWNGLPLVIFGSSGISKEVAFLVEDINNHFPVKLFDFVGFVESDPKMVGRKSSIYDIVSCDRDFAGFAARFPVLGIVLPIGFPKVKRKIFSNVLADIENLVFPNLIHPSVSVKRETLDIGVGNIITAGVRLTTSIKIGNFNLFNLNSTVGHDVVIGDFCVINPVATISGGVTIEDDVLVGTGGNVLQNITLKARSTVGAGALVSKEVPEDTTVVGIPAKPLAR